MRQKSADGIGNDADGDDNRVAVVAQNKTVNGLGWGGIPPSYLWIHDCLIFMIAIFPIIATKIIKTAITRYPPG